MDWICKALLTAAMVGLVMVADRKGGRHVAGVVAALPTLTAPTLGWLAHDHGTAVAIPAAIASISACAMLAFFALGYALAARRGGVLLSLAGGSAAAALMAWPAYLASARLLDASALAGACSLLAWRLIPSLRGTGGLRRNSTGRAAALAVAVAGVAALAASFGPALGSFATGTLSSLPLIGGAVVVAEHAAGGERAVAGFLRGYVLGLGGKAVFGAVFATTSVALGAPAALALACTCAGAVSMARSLPPGFGDAWRAQRQWRRP